MTKAEITTIRNIVKRLSDERLGAASCFEPLTYEQRNYINTWVKGPLALLLPGETRDTKLAAKMSGQ